MTKVLSRASNIPAERLPAEPALVIPEDSNRRVSIMLQVVDRGNVRTKSWEIPLPNVEEYEKAFDRVTAEFASGGSVGRPGTRLILVKINQADPEFVGGEFAPDLGEVISVVDVVKFFVLAKNLKTSEPLIRYHLRTHKVFLKCGYTFKRFEDFKRDVVGPAAKDFEDIALAHIKWCEENEITPFE